MSIFDGFPLMNAYSINLDWIMKKIREIEEYVRNYTAVNKVAYAGVWDITKQYPQWALVTDGDTSWLSLQPVPKGIPLENADYWQKLADLDPRIAGIIKTLNNMHIVNVLSYGAKGDGLTDDTAAVQNALDSAHKAGCVVFFPAGVYMVSGVTVNSSVSIIGEGQDSSVLRLISGSVGASVVKSEGFDTLTGTNNNGGVSGVTIRDITLDGNGVLGSFGLRKYGYRWNISNAVFCNCRVAGVYTEWGTNAGAPDDGKYMEDVFYNIRCHHNNDGFIYNGAHDALFDTILLYLNDRYGFVCNVSEVYSGAGAVITKMHAYANGSDGVVLNAQTIADGLISESNNAQETPGAGGGCGVVVNANNCLLTNLYCYTNIAGAGVKLNAGYCIINGILPSNKSGVEIVQDSGTNSIEVSIYTGAGQTAIANVDRVSHASQWKAMCTGSDFKIVQSAFDISTFDVPLPGGTGRENGWTNNTLTPVVGYQYGGEQMHNVDVSGVDTELPSPTTFIVLPGNTVYFAGSAPTYWKFKPLTV